MPNVLSLIGLGPKSISNDSYNFPAPQCYESEVVQECGSFKVYLTNPEINANGDFVWTNVESTRGKLNLTCVSAKYKRLYCDGLPFIARIEQKGKIIRRQFEPFFIGPAKRTSN